MNNINMLENNNYPIDPTVQQLDQGYEVSKYIWGYTQLNLSVEFANSLSALFSSSFQHLHFQDHILDVALMLLIDEVLDNDNRRQIRLYMRYLHESRNQFGAYVVHILQMRRMDGEQFKYYVGVDRTTYAELLAGVGPLLLTEPTHRYPIGPDARLAIFFRFVTLPYVITEYIRAHTSIIK